MKRLTFSMVIWSLVHEMRISIIFPLIIFISIKLDWKISGIFVFLLSIISFFLIKEIPTKFNIPISTNYFITLHYLGMFIMGFLIAKHKDFLINKYLNLYQNIALVLIAILFFNYPKIPLMVPYKLFGEIDFLLYTLMTDCTIGIGASLIVILALRSIAFSRSSSFNIHSFYGRDIL